MAINAEVIKLDPNPFKDYYIAQGYRVGDLIFISGQVAITEDGTIIEGDFDTQAEATFRNIQRVLEAAGSSLAKVIKVTIYLTDMQAHRGRIMELRQEWFTPPYPADTLVGVKELGHPSRLLEIEAIALASGDIIG
ncbi:MAG: enamine deaminase RidA [Alphaproteobacteria bacterium]|nr:enamine deaminase RidA [Alphaproteobacteria bacterium]|tara:strand:+ start:263 stop:670 length:408 start_codon:yes stop_codon:yes gene_type:complete